MGRGVAMTDVAQTSGNGTGTATGQRIDKWLWHARTARTRTLAATLVAEGKVQVNGIKIEKPAHVVRVGDTITVVMRQEVHILRVTGFSERRGSASVAGALYLDLTVRVSPEVRAAEELLRRTMSDGLREPGSGRPTKRERRQTDRFKQGA
jgi:ribosome-associated heat shock protein Hsp15